MSKTTKRNTKSVHNNRYSDGAFVMWSARLTAAAMSSQDIRDMANAAGLPESIVPDYAGDRAICSRVIDRHASKLKRQGYVLSKLKRTKSHVLMTIHETSRDIAARETELPQAGTLEWTSETNGIVSPEQHTVADYLDYHYQDAVGKIHATDWSSTLIAYLQDECLAQAWRDDGRVYWVPPTHLDRVRELQDWLQSVGVSLAVAEIDGAVRESVVEVVEASLVDQLDELQAEVDGFNGLQKPSTYADRIERYHELRKRVTVHTECLGIAKSTANSLLKQLEDMEVTVVQHLATRENIRVKRDGTIEQLAPATDEYEDSEDEETDNETDTPVVSFDW